jgi:hypothetical protein
VLMLAEVAARQYRAPIPFHSEIYRAKRLKRRTLTGMAARMLKVLHSHQLWCPDGDDPAIAQ